MKLSKWALALGIFTSVALLAGCGSGSSNSSDGVTTVKVAWRATGKGDSMYRIYSKKWIADFEKKNPKK